MSNEKGVGISKRQVIFIKVWCRNTDLTLATGVLADQPPPDWELEPGASSSGTVHSSRCGSTHTHTHYPGQIDQ
ncbi:hypothetical protein RRG08_028019 [Elysia crispata]|uniref:Uncharacterized protein n=1 Tax=Elysia crispata TaxID=231223 RepID=A0AAE1EEP4_9GAST|nr:hypothetical protein RRG08_028019 [Elysia crispata]